MVSEVPPVYLRIIDDIGRRLYSGKITWLREYIQNSIDAGSAGMKIELKGVDLEISDKGKGMDQETLINQAFSLGGKFKSASQIGELGIGMYAGSGTCDRIYVLTKMKKNNVYEATIDMKKFRELIRDNPNITFEEGMRQIFRIVDKSSDYPDFGKDDSFTKLRFEELSRDTLTLIQEANLAKFVEYTVNLPAHDKFKHKASVSEFLGKDNYEVTVTLKIEGVDTELKKFAPDSIKFTDTFWGKPIVDKTGKEMGKLWAVYNKGGQSLDDARIMVKRKGLTVGDASYVVSKFGAKYSPRFFGEIVLTDETIEINTSRDWFVDSERLKEFIEQARIMLNQLFGIADFDSKVAVGTLNLIDRNKILASQAKMLEKRGDLGSAAKKLETVEANKAKIARKIQDALYFVEQNKEEEKVKTDPTTSVKIELINRTLSNPEVSALVSAIQQGPKPPTMKKGRKNPFPEIVRSFLKSKIIDQGLAHRIGDGDIKDTTDRAFTFIEQKFKEKLGKREQENIEWDILIRLFKKEYKPPDLKGFSEEKYFQAFDQIMKGFYELLRNQSHHTFMDDMNNQRNLFEVILITDFMVNWIDQWIKKN